jgi:hypothetical protein
MEIKDIIASHIIDDVKRNNYMTGMNGQYRVSNLELPTNFSLAKDGNTYIFDSCFISNASLSFESEFIGFRNCVFKGKVNIHNKGIGKDDLIGIKDTVSPDLFAELVLASSYVEIEDSNICCEQNIKMTAVECSIFNSNIKAKDISINYLDGCSIENCSIGIINNINDEDLDIINSYINGQLVNGEDFESDEIIIDYSKRL